MKLLITGGAGFIGSQLTDYFLGKGHVVSVIDNLSWGKHAFIAHNLPNKKFSFYKADLLDYQKVLKMFTEDIDTVFHLAANSDIMRGAIDPDIDFANTTVATFHVLKAMREKNIKRIFFLSGSGVYGNVGKKIIKETFGPLYPVSMYGATKLSAEGMISAFVNLYDMQAWILRPANIIGPRATHGVIFDFINQLKKDPRHLRILGDGKQTKSYLYVDDVLAAMDVVWHKSRVPIDVFNLTSTTYISVNEIAKLVIQGMGLKDVRETRTGGRGGWKGDVPIIKMDNSKLERFGWHSTYTTKQAVKKTIDNLLHQ